jgi:hypothetical protein
MGRKPFCTASTAVARTQPDVVQPVMIRVSARRFISREARSVPKKQDAYFLTSRLSVLRMSSRSSISTAGVPAFSVSVPFILIAQRPASFRSWSL